MYQKIIAVSVLLALVACRFVSSNDSTDYADTRPSLAPHTTEPLSADQIDTISDVRASNGIDFLRGEENDQLFRDAIQSEARQSQTNRFPPILGEPQMESVPDSGRLVENPPSDCTALLNSLLQSAALLDQRATQLEQSNDHLGADKSHNLAQRLRLAARTIKFERQ